MDCIHAASTVPTKPKHVFKTKKCGKELNLFNSINEHSFRGMGTCEWTPIFRIFFGGGGGTASVCICKYEKCISMCMHIISSLNYTPHTKLTKASIKVFSSISKRKRTCPIVRKLFSGENRHVTPPATTSTAA
jgi:hypothetical protein